MPYAYCFPAGLDISHRPRLLSLLKSFHQNSQPHIIMALRAQDPIPDWITHLLFIQSQNRIISGAKQHVFPELVSMTTNLNQKSMPTSPTLPKQAPGNILVDLQNVNVKYHDRHVTYIIILGCSLFPSHRENYCRF